MAVSRPNFVELCLALTESDERAFEELWRRLGLSVDWSMTYTTIGALAQRISQRSFLGLLARGEAYQLEAPTLWDVDFQTAVAQAELEDRERPGRDAPRPLRRRRRRPRRADRDDAAGADRGVRGAARAPRGRAPRAARRARGAHAAVRHERAGDDAPRGRAREGHGPGDGVHVRRPHRRDVVARAEPAGAVGARARRAPARRALGRARLGDRGPRARASELRAAARQHRQPGAQAHRRAARGVRRARRRAAAGDARREVLREGRAPGRDRHEPPVVHAHARPPRGADRARARAALAPAVHACALRGLGERAHRRLVRQPPALLRRALPGLVSDRRRRRDPARRSRSWRARSSCPSIPPPTCPTATRRPTAGGPEASRATPT